MGDLIAAHDWAASPLGPIAAWPAALRVAVGMLVSSAFPKCLCWGRDLIAIYNDAFVPILAAKHPCLGRPFSDIWAEAWHEIGPIAERALAGEATYIEDFPLVINRSGTPEEANFTFCYSPVRDETGAVRGMLDTVVETTGKVRAERAALIRNRELVHRSRNAYALVSALVSQTHRHSRSLDEAQAKLQLRLASLNRAQDILARESAPEAMVGAVVDRTLDPFRSEPGAISFSGPEVWIGSDRVTALALALHEMATNASKYGALSVPEGRVDIAWHLDRAAGGPLFRFDWRESGGPLVVPSDRRGFGSFLVTQALPQEFGGDVALDHLPAGVTLRLTAQLPAD